MASVQAHSRQYLHLFVSSLVSSLFVVGFSRSIGYDKAVWCAGKANVPGHEMWRCLRSKGDPKAYQLEASAGEVNLRTAGVGGLATV